MPPLTSSAESTEFDANFDAQITAAQLAADSVTSTKIGDNAINSVAFISSGLITSDLIADGAIVAGDLAANSVDSAELVSGSIDTIHLGNLQVTTSKLANGTVTQTKLADNSVTTAKIVAGNVDTTELAADAVTAAKIDAGALNQTFTGTQVIPTLNATTRLQANKIGIQDTNPPQKLHIDEVAGMDVGSASSTATTTFTLDSFTAATFRTAKYLLQVHNSTDTNFHAIEIFLFHDGSTVYLTQYASIYDNGVQATFDADISSGNVRLRVTPASGDTMAYKYIRTTIEV